MSSTTHAIGSRSCFLLIAAHQFSSASSKVVFVCTTLSHSAVCSPQPLITTTAAHGALRIKQFFICAVFPWCGGAQKSVLRELNRNDTLRRAPDASRAPGLCGPPAAAAENVSGWALRRCRSRSSPEGARQPGRLTRDPVRGPGDGDTWRLTDVFSGCCCCWAAPPPLSPPGRPASTRPADRSSTRYTVHASQRI